MHDGRFSTLEEVVDFYSTGIQDNPGLALALREGRAPNGDPIRLNFTAAQKDALIAFLETLTDNTFLTNDLFSDPFEELPGDFDGSGLVDAADLAFWQSEADDGDGFLQWQQNLGRSWLDLAPISSITAVPEPSTGLLASCMSICALSRRRKDRY